MMNLTETFETSKWEKVNSKLKNFDVYVRYVDTSHRLDGSDVVDTDVFENLESIRKIRKDKGKIVIGYDTEFQYITEKERIILSYQFAVYLNDNEVLELFFASRKPLVENRLTMKDCMNYVMTYLFNSDKCNTLYYTGAYRLKYYDDNNQLCYKNFNTKYSDKEVMQFIKENDIKNVIFKIDRSHVKEEDAKKLKSFHSDIILLAHAGIVDVSAFKEGNSKAFLRKLTSLQGGVVTLDNCYKIAASDFTKTYNCEFPLLIGIRDSMCFAPKGNQSLDALGKCIKVNKMEVPIEVKKNMLDFYVNDFENFRKYACQDSLVTLIYTSRLWGKNRDMPVTVTSAAADFVYNSVISYFNLAGKPKEVDKMFKKLYEGIDVTDFTDINKNGKCFTNHRDCKTMEIQKLDLYFTDAYVGGWNTCGYPGIVNHPTYDYDVIKAYSDSQSLIKDIDYTNPIKEEYTNIELSLGMIESPDEIAVATVDFEFPDNVKFPCIPVRFNGNAIYPKRGENVTICASTIFLALKLGAKLHAHSFIKCNTLKNLDGTDSMSLGNACKILSNDRDTCKSVYGDDSVEEMLIKSLLTATYGKLGQGLIDKRKWNTKTDETEQLERSKVTSSYRATMTTALVRDLLFAMANESSNLGYNWYSVTTDGFISNILEDKLNAMLGYGFVELFKQSRIFLSGKADLWKKKHQQDALLLNPTTRCNIGFGTGYDKQKKEFVEDIHGNKGVLAHGSFQTDKEPDSYEDHLELFKTIVGRTDRKPKYAYDEWISLKDMFHSGCDFYTIPKEKTGVFNFDFKRKPDFASLHDVTGTFEGIDYTYATFDTKPFEDIEECKMYYDLGQTYEVLKTSADWKDYQMRLRMKQSGKNIKISNYAWTQLVSVIRLYRQNKISIPVLDKCDTLKEKLIAINIFNHSNRHFTETNWKSCARADRINQILPFEDIKELLDSIDAKFIDTGEHSGN
jgi:hypothetical protein